MIEKIKIKELTPTVVALRKMDRDFKKAAKEESLKIAEIEAKRIVAAASTKAERMVARSIRARRGATPGIAAGGSMPLRNSEGRAVKAGMMFFGTEFGGRGSKRTRQFRPHKGTEGYFFWPTIRHDSPIITSEWVNAIEILAADWDD